MSIVTRFKTTVSTVQKGIKNATVGAAQKVGGGIATAAQLSPKEIEEIDAKRKEYLSAKPSMDDAQAQSVVKRALGAIGIEVFQAYLPQLKELYLPVDMSNEHFDTRSRIRYFDITKWVTDKEEDSIKKLINVYGVLNREECNAALIYHKTINDCTVSLAISNTKESSADSADSNSFCERLQGAVKGNFPGAAIGQMKADTPEAIESCCLSSYHIVTVSNLASEKSEKFISQSLEKLFDGVALNGEEEYTIVLLAEPIAAQTEERKARLYELYTALAPYAVWQTNYTYTDTSTIGSQASAGINAGVGAGRQQGSSAGTSQGMQHSVGSSESTTETAGTSTGSSNTVGGHVGNNVGVDASHTSTHSKFSSTSHTIAKNISDAVSKTTSAVKSYGTNTFANFGLNFSRSSNVSMTVGKNEGIVNTYTNYGIKNTLEIIEEQIKRLEESAALGMWDFAAYIISNDANVAENAANMYLSLTQGENSFMTTSAVNVWDESASKVIMNSIKKLKHPMFGMKMNDDRDWYMYPTAVNAATGISGKELAYALNFPKKSISGFPVLECASFGREVHKYINTDKGKSINIGNIYHMRNVEPISVSLDQNSLASHTFITGSTGAGKSNTIYRMLGELKRNGVKFLVIEPAKGEYKNVFGHDKDVSVYGTNPAFTELLRINPFSFPEGIHVYEHIDRLIEIFNACWPMYAAMPAVLKDAVVRAYEEAGWDMRRSENKYGLFPTFADVLYQIDIVIRESQYSADSKGDYIGALSTRLRSLTNGINGMIFTSDELSDKALFEENAIVDISRVGSTETKALIMGMLIMKQQEHYMAGQSESNEALKHVTVLEEAHTLLKRTSSEQVTESANLVGKSVEMIANAIAEMRTYGEGFIIADQSPGLLDISVIRNTNTKIILRLPEYSDRELVGRAAGLNDNQIEELSKLKRGVAAVYQNDWVEAVLCSVEEYVTEARSKYIEPDKKDDLRDGDIHNIIATLINKRHIENIDEFTDRVMKTSLRSGVKRAVADYLYHGYYGSKTDLREIVDKLVNFYEITSSMNVCPIDRWCNLIEQRMPSHDFSSDELTMIIGLILNSPYGEKIDDMKKRLYMDHIQRTEAVI